MYVYMYVCMLLIFGYIRTYLQAFLTGMYTCLHNLSIHSFWHPSIHTVHTFDSYSAESPAITEGDSVSPDAIADVGVDERTIESGSTYINTRDIHTYMLAKYYVYTCTYIHIFIHT